MDALPAYIIVENGDRLNLCPGGCGTYVDDLNIDPHCSRCQFDILVGDGIPRAKVADMAATMGANPDYVAALRNGWPVK